MSDQIKDDAAAALAQVNTLGKFTADYETVVAEATVDAAVAEGYTRAEIEDAARNR